MAIIIGEETLGATVRALALERGYLTKRKGLKTGKVASLAVKVAATSKATKWRLAIFTAVASKPSTLLAETATITVATETALTVEGTITQQELTEGTEYFLGVLPLDATGQVKYTEKTGWGFKSTLKITELSKGVYTEESALYGEPAAIWGEEPAATGLVNPLSMII